MRYRLSCLREAERTGQVAVVAPHADQHRLDTDGLEQLERALQSVRPEVPRLIADEQHHIALPHGRLQGLLLVGAAPFLERFVEFVNYRGGQVVLDHIGSHGSDGFRQGLVGDAVSAGVAAVGGAVQHVHGVFVPFHQPAPDGGDQQRPTVRRERLLVGDLLNRGDMTAHQTVAAVIRGGDYVLELHSVLS